MRVPFRSEPDALRIAVALALLVGVSILVGWLDEPELRDFAPVVEQLAGT